MWKLSEFLLKLLDFVCENKPSNGKRDHTFKFLDEGTKWISRGSLFFIHGHAILFLPQYVMCEALYLKKKKDNNKKKSLQSKAMFFLKTYIISSIKTCFI